MNSETKDKLYRIIITAIIAIIFVGAIAMLVRISPGEFIILSYLLNKDFYQSLNNKP